MRHFSYVLIFVSLLCDVGGLFDDTPAPSPAADTRPKSAAYGLFGGGDLFADEGVLSAVWLLSCARSRVTSLCSRAHSGLESAPRHYGCHLTVWRRRRYLWWYVFSRHSALHIANIKCQPRSPRRSSSRLSAATPAARNSCGPAARPRRSTRLRQPLRSCGALSISSVTARR